MKFTLIPPLIAKLKDHFPNRQFYVSGSGNAVIYPAAHAEVGDLEIHDEGGEITLYLGRFTHSHINNFGEKLSEEEDARKIVASIIAFLHDLFDDKVVLWGSQKGGGGTYRVGSVPNSAFPPRGPRYVWSGPYHAD